MKKPTQLAISTGWAGRKRGSGTKPNRQDNAAFMIHGAPKEGTAPSRAPGSAVSTPRTRYTVAMTKPARGPAAPTSNRILRLGMGDRMRMKAPNVPTMVGPGRK